MIITNQTAMPDSCSKQGHLKTRETYFREKTFFSTADSLSAAAKEVILK